MTIRKALKNDIKELAELASTTYVDAFGSSFRQEELQSRLEQTRSESYFAKVLKRDVILVAEKHTRFVGYVEFGKPDLLVATEENDQEISRLYVRKEWQGKGIGKSLIDAALSHKNMRNAPNIWLDVWEGNEGAIRLYKSYGFVETGTIIDGDIIMVKRKHEAVHHTGNMQKDAEKSSVVPGQQ
jgi:ribosomal protein S18 acetylase RimI-like enzyme